MYYTLEFKPAGKHIMVKEGTTVLAAARLAGVSIEAMCNGIGQCGQCEIRILEGQVSAITATEKAVLSAIKQAQGFRLACRTKVLSDLCIEIKKEVTKPVILSPSPIHHIEMHPNVCRYTLNIEALDPLKPQAALERVQKALKQQCNHTQAITATLGISKKLQKYMGKKSLSLDVWVYQDQRIIGVFPQNSDAPLGVAIDIGTTTMTFSLYQLETGQHLAEVSALNPQIDLGEDIISRIHYAQEAVDGTQTLHKLLIESLNHALIKLCEVCQCQVEQIAEMTIAANTVMTHFLLGLSTESLGVAPFMPFSHQAWSIAAKTIGIHILEEGQIYVLPSVRGFIGGDHTAVLATVKPYTSKQYQLIMDIGTNSEVCIGNEEGLFVTSCATGPALEGGNLTCGMRASAGAVEGVHIDSKTLKPTLKVIGAIPPKGLCGSGVIECVAEMLRTGIIEKSGRFNPQIESPRIRQNAKGKKEYVLVFAEEGSERDLSITIDDLRAVQLAKGALYAGVQMLLKKVGRNQVDTLILAGAFGAHLNKHKALQIGLFPDLPLDKVKIVGNIAGEGAARMLLDRQLRFTMEKVTPKITAVETAGDPAFQTAFLEALSLPHETAPFTANFSGRWPCQGQDTRVLPQDFQVNDKKIFTEKAEMIKVAQVLGQSQRISIFPPMQNFEAVLLGAPIQKTATGFTCGNYIYKALPEADGFGYFSCEHPYVQTLLKAIRSQEDKKTVLEMEGPFSILGALIDPMILYQAGKQQPALLYQILDRITRSLIQLSKQAIRAGINIISFADPLGVYESVGQDFYQAFSGRVMVAFLKGIEPALDQAIVHLCGKTSAGLIKTGTFLPQVLRGKREYTALQNILTFSQDPKIRIIGQSCMHNLEKPQVLFTQLVPRPENASFAKPIKSEQ